MILARVYMRQTKGKDDIAYALAGIVSVHIALAYGEKERARDGLLQELATQKGDLSFMSFATVAHSGGIHLPRRWQEIFRLA